MHSNLKDNKQAINKINDKLDTFEFALGTTHKQITQLNNERKRMQDSLLYLQSQSMRNNLVFTGLTEDIMKTTRCSFGRSYHVKLF